MSAREHYEQGFNDASARWMRRAARYAASTWHSTLIWLAMQKAPTARRGRFHRAMLRADRIARGKPAFAKAATTSEPGAGS